MALSRLKHGFESRWGHHGVVGVGVAPSLVPARGDAKPCVPPRHCPYAYLLLQILLRDFGVHGRGRRVPVPEVFL